MAIELLDRGISLSELAGRVGITLADLSILKTNRAKAVRFSTLEALCRELDCQPADLWCMNRMTKAGEREAAVAKASVRSYIFVHVRSQCASRCRQFESRFGHQGGHR